MTGKLILAILCVSTIVVDGDATPSSRILGGSDAPTEKYPWAVSVRVNGSHTCMGTIINNHHIITAGHCVLSIESSRVTARIGSVNKFAGGQIVQIKSIVIHPLYGNFLHDIAILEVDQTLTFNQKIDKITLADKNTDLPAGTPISATGWGLQENGTSPYKLKRVSMRVQSASDCESEAGFGYESVICMAHPENTGICEGDEGTGIVSGRILVGVGSFAFGSCGTKYPDIASKISYYNSWIESVIKGK